jgi:light-regulated signal transduction histidine kinase (bacteriophytochrome)
MAIISNNIAMGIERLKMLEERERLLASEQAARQEAEISLQQVQELNTNLEAIVVERTKVLTQLNTELERSNQELQDFAYVASHDLQEPLRKIQAFGNLLEEEYGESLGDGKTYLDRMRNAAGRMRVLIDDLLTFSRVTTKAQPFSLVNLNEVVEQVIDDLGPRIQEIHGIVEVGELPMIEADSQQMYHMFQNLLSNALKFHRTGVPPKVKVTAQEQPAAETTEFPATEQYLFAIEDNGIGFDEKYLDRIFTVFQRLHGRNQYEGTGIGLAVVRKIVERHGGTITAKSVIGEGATFLVTLPAKHN